jgi:hypothetical protein
MPSVFTEQFPNGVIERIVTGEDAQDRNDYTVQSVFPPLSAGVFVPEVNPFVPWTFGAITEVIPSCPNALQILALDLDSAAIEDSVYRIFKGPAGQEVPIAEVSVSSTKNAPRPVTCETLKAGTRVSVALAAAATGPASASVKLITREVVEES